MSLRELCSRSDDSSLPSREDVFELASRVIKLAAFKKLLVSTAESCTGGLVCAALTDVAGSSEVVQGGACTYAFSAKTSLLGVRQETLDSVGAVSEECAREMACGSLQAFASHCAVSTTGIAGPGGAVPGKPVGTVCFGIGTDSLTLSATRHFSGNRQEVRTKSVAFALELLCEALEES